MKRVLIATLLSAIGLTTSGLAQTASKAPGHWQGKIQIPDHELAITVDLAKDAKGAWIGSMSVVASTAADVPLMDIAVDDTTVKFAANLPDRAFFTSKLSADGNTLAGTASSSAGEAPFQLTRNGDASVKTATPSSALSKDFEGAWEGSVTVGGQARQVGLKLSAASDGAATATLTVVEGNQQIPITTVTIKDKDLVLEARAVSGAFRGTLGASGEISGEWTQGAQHVPLTFKRAKP